MPFIYCRLYYFYYITCCCNTNMSPLGSIKYPLSVYPSPLGCLAVVKKLVIKFKLYLHCTLKLLCTIDLFNKGNKSARIIRIKSSDCNDYRVNSELLKMCLSAVSVPQAIFAARLNDTNTKILTSLFTLPRTKLSAINSL